MPFKSERQRRWMHANKPQMAARWERESKGKTVKNKPTTQGIAKRMKRIKAKTGMGTAEAGKLAIKRAKSYRAGKSPIPNKNRPVPARPNLKRAVAYAKRGKA